MSDLNMVITMPDTVIDPECKRFKLPGAVITVDCPGCGRRVSKGLDETFEYPRLGTPENVHICCHPCADEYYEFLDTAVEREFDGEFTVQVYLRLTIEPAE